MAKSVHHVFPKLTVSHLLLVPSQDDSVSTQSGAARRRRRRRQRRPNTDTGTQRITVKKGNDSLDICRVLNGMWQTSGGWSRINCTYAVDAMLRYADAGLSAFDMADHCKLK